MSVHLTQQGKGQPLVLFHGWGFDSSVWHAVSPLLSNQFELYLVDLPGFGLTPSMSWDAFKTSLLQQIPDKVIMAGWSMGGLFASRFAIEEPRVVTHLINICSSPRFIRDEHWPGVDESVFKAFYLSLMSNPMLVLQQFMELQFKRRLHFVPELGRMVTVEALRAGLLTLMEWDLRETVRQCQQPVLYMFGRLDVITPGVIMERMKILYPEFQYHLFSKAAHAPFLSHSDEFLSVIEGFVR